jgi:4-hydroxy-tetrahydrodipicolinate synthase
MKIHGLYTAIITPFDADNKLDEESLKQNIRFQISQGVDGITVLGTTGEAPTLSAHEKERVMVIAKKECEGKVHFMVGTGSYSTEQTIQNTLSAKKMGADFALIVAPYYNKPTQQGLYLHFRSIAEAVPELPILLYNNITRTCQNINVPTLLRLAEIPNIVGVKEATDKINHVMEVIEVMRVRFPKFSIVSGDDSLIFPLMALGGHGAVSVSSNLVPGMISELVRALQQGDFDIARSFHYKLMPLFRAAFVETNPIPIKAAMEMCGMAAGKCRLPLCDLSVESLELLEMVLKQYEISSPVEKV